MDISDYDNNEYDSLDKTYNFSTIADGTAQGKKFNQYLKLTNSGSSNTNTTFTESWVDFNGNNSEFPAKPTNDSIVSNIKYFYILKNEYIEMYNKYIINLPQENTEDVSALETKATQMKLQGQQIIDAINNNHNVNSHASNEILNMVNEIHNSINIIDITPRSDLTELMETSKLTTTSSYYHYIVYLFLCLLIIGCIINSYTHPDNNYTSKLSILLYIVLVYTLFKVFQ